MNKITGSAPITPPIDAINQDNPSPSPFFPPPLDLNTQDSLKHRNIFKANFESFILKTEKLEKSARFKTTLLKTLFITLLVLGIICASSFFLLPVLGSLSTALGISLAATKIAWQVIFLGGGLMAGLSFIPRRFIKGFAEDLEHYHQKAETLKDMLNKQQDFEKFLALELAPRKQPEVIAAAPEFTELYYLLQILKTKKNEQEVDRLKHQLGYEQDKNADQRMMANQEIQELENEISDLRAALSRLDR